MGGAGTIEQAGDAQVVTAVLLDGKALTPVSRAFRNARDVKLPLCKANSRFLGRAAMRRSVGMTQGLCPIGNGMGRWFVKPVK